MARISTYSIDQVITENDKWIGTDSSGSITKNFTPKKLGEYFNESNSLGIADQIAFKYYGTFDYPRPEGSITLQSFQPSFSNIVTAKVSQKSSGKKIIVDFLDTLVETEVIISDAADINSFGKYYLKSITQDIDEPTFYNLELEFIEGHGSLIDKNIYIVAFHSNKVEGDKNYIHTQALSSATWEITHSLNKFPSVSVIDSDNKLVVGDVEYIDTNNVTITFSGAFSGKAYLN